MAEDSYLWTTGGAGDGSATYTRADWQRIAKIIGAVHGHEGVAPALLNALAGSVTGANTVQINTGGALVDGKPYDSDAAVNVNIPSAVGVGNTRIDRVVLRADWTAQTVRITRIAGTDAASPTAPAITQNSGVTYDIKLYQALVNTSGTVTLTDERELAYVVPQFYRRQGGSSTDWSSPGSTTYIPTAVRMQAGTRLFSGVVSGGTDVVTVTFPTAFSNPPLVFCSFQISGSTPSLSGGAVCWVSGVGASSFELRMYQVTGSTADFEVSWWAIGPE